MLERVNADNFLFAINCLAIKFARATKAVAKCGLFLWGRTNEARGAKNGRAVKGSEQVVA